VTTASKSRARGLPVELLTPDVRERFWGKVDRSTGPDACWPWRGAISGRYGYFRLGSLKDGTRRQVGAHQVACVLRHGSLMPDQEPHHTCRNGRCVNPAHLEPRDRPSHDVEHTTDRIVSGRRLARHPNTVKSWGRFQREKTHCRNGHPYDDDNTMRSGSERICRTCSKAAGIRHRLKQGQAVTLEIRSWLDEFDRDVRARRRT
jgi:hypothetical protein